MCGNTRKISRRHISKCPILTRFQLRGVFAVISHVLVSVWGEGEGVCGRAAGRPVVVSVCSPPPGRAAPPFTQHTHRAK